MTRELLVFFFGEERTADILSTVERDGEWSGIIPVDKPIIKIVKKDLEKT